MTGHLRKVDRGLKEEPAGAPGEHETPPAAPGSKGQPSRPDEALSSQIDNLQGAAEKASGHVRNLYLFFLSFGLYLAIIFGSTTHEQLLRENPVILPLFNVELPLRGFYWVAPALFVLLHFNLLVQCYLLAGKLKRLDDAIRGLGGRRQAVERARLDVFPFTQMLLGDHRSPLAHRLPAIMAWATIVVAPIMLLLFGQASFLPYHDASTTWWHRFLVVLDLASLWLLWSIATDLSGRWRRRLRAWWRLVRRGPTALVPDRSLAVAYVSSCRRTLDLDRWPAAVLGIIRLPRRIYRRHISLRRQWRPVFLEELGAIAVVASFLLVTIPGEFLALPIDRLVGERGGLGISRNLIVRETNLVGSWPTQAQIDQHAERLAWQNFGAPPSLGGRDLRYADLSKSILVRGDFRDANLQGAGLYSANLQGADFFLANLEGTDLRAASLQGAQLSGSNLQGADLVEANLQGAYLWNANLQGADLSQANLKRADVSGASFLMALLRNADLEGAVFGNANLQGAVFWNANLRGADLGAPRLQGGLHAHPDLEAANLIARLPLSGAQLRGADLRAAHLWRAHLDQRNLADRWALADLRGVDLHPIKDVDSWIEEGTQQIPEKATRDRVAAQLRAALRDENRPEVPSFPDSWRSGANVMFDPGDPVPKRLGWETRRWETVDAYDEDLASLLIDLACSEGVTVHVAEGLVRRMLPEASASRISGREVRLYVRRLAARLLSDDCPPAAELPDDMRKQLEELAASGEP